MKTQLILVGKTTNKHLATVIDDYVGRIGHYMPFSVVVVPELKNTKALSEEQQKEREGELILQKIKPTDTLVLLDERGSELGSVAFSQWLQRKLSSARNLVFVIGGPYGFSKAVYNRADEQLSLSRMTFSHQLIRVVFAEQLYRACTIIKGEPYHHE